MKKILVLGVMAALAFGAWAEGTYSVRISTGLSVKGAGKFTAADVANYYTAYSMSDEQAAAVMGIEYKTGVRISAADVKTWLDKNYVKNASAWMTAGTEANSSYKSKRMQNEFYLGGSGYQTASDAFEANRLVILFYHGPKEGIGDDVNGYRIVGLNDSSWSKTDNNWVVNSTTTGDWAGDGTKDQGWVLSKGPAPIPEPTSALLMLLGVAGLALRRRNK